MPETQNIEYKSIWKDEYLKWICGFANAQGGTLYIGKDDNGNVVGAKKCRKAIGRITQQDNNHSGNCGRHKPPRNP